MSFYSQASQPPKRASESADDSAAKKTEISDTRPAMSESEVVEFNTVRERMIKSLEKSQYLLDTWELDVEDSDNPSPDALQELRVILRATETTRHRLEKLLTVRK